MQPLMINIIYFNAENTGWPQSILQWSILDLLSLVTLCISLCSICKLGMFLASGLGIQSAVNGTPIGKSDLIKNYIEHERSEP